jgi:hypothetical protein
MTDEQLRERLNVSTIDVKPINIDGWDRREYAEDGEDDPQWWEVITYSGQGYDNLTLMSQTNRIIGLVHEGNLYESWDDYEADVFDEAQGACILDGEEGEDPDDCTTHDHEDPEGVVLGERDWDSLMDVSPHEWGGEGPMMNYWYPLEERVSDWSSFSPAGAAMTLGQSSLVVVEVDGSYGLALAGGGMDFSWQICEAYVTLGYAPPAHFADLPAMAESWTEGKERVYEAMKFSLTWLIDNCQYRLKRLDDLRERGRQ